MSGSTRRIRQAISLRDRKIGDDWKFHAVTADDVSGWATGNMTVELRGAESATATLFASTDDGTATLDGDVTIDVPASTFSATGGDLWILVPRAETIGIRPGPVFMEVSVDADPVLMGRETVGTFVFMAVQQVAVESSP
jgi:hypothetical protein